MKQATNTIIIILAIILLTNTAITEATTIPLDPCGTTNSYETGQQANTELNLENNCIKITLNKNPYNPNIDFYDKINNENFKLHLTGLQERETISPFRIRNETFASMGLTGNTEGNKIYYTNGQTTIGYELQGRKLKAYATINNYAFQYANSELWVETKYSQNTKGTIIHLAPTIDGIKKPVITETKTAGGNNFYQQKLGRGNNIILDPIYVVDYSPVPASHLINGIVETDPDSSFTYQTDISSGLSDNLTSTNYTTRNQQNWWNTSFKKRKDINLTSTTSTTLTNYTIYLKVNYDTDMQTDYDDLRFLNGTCSQTGGTILAYEIDTYNSTQADLWIRLPQLKNGLNSLCMYYNHSTATSGQNITGAWDEFYVMVQHLEETTGTHTDSTRYGNNGTNSGSTTNQTGKIGTANNFNGLTNVIQIPYSLSMDISRLSTWTIEAWVNVPSFTGLQYPVIFVQGDFRAGMSLSDASGGTDGRIESWVNDGSGAISNTAVPINTWTNVALRFNTTARAFYFNGGIDGTATLTDPTNVTEDFGIGNTRPTAPDAGFGGRIDEVRVSSTSRSTDWLNQNYDLIQNQETRVSFSQEEDVTKQAITGRWNQTLDSAYTWYALINKITDLTENITIHAYNDSNNVSSQKITRELSGTGWFNINVTSLIDYMTNTKGLTFTQLRIYTEKSISFSELLLRKEANDTQAPSVTNCTSLNGTSFTCSDNTISLRCDITDNIGVNNANFQINGINNTAHIHEDKWYVDYTLPTIDGTLNYNWTRAYATDLSGNTNTTTISIQFNKTCNYAEYINITHTATSTDRQIGSDYAVINWTTSNPANSTITYGLTTNNLNQTKTNSALQTTHSLTLSNLTNSTTYYYNLTSETNPTQTTGTYNFTTLSGCVENWTPNYDNCLTNDTRLLTYNDTNACGTNDDLPIDNNTMVSCNYCSQFIVQELIGTCQTNNTIPYNYTDENYNTCCLVTGLASDCQINTYPYNETGTTPCTYLTQEFNCTLDPYPILNKKININCELPNTQTHECIVNVYQEFGNGTKNLLSTTPEYKKTSDNFLFFPQEEELRTTFTTNNGLLNAYYTNKELRPNDEFQVEVKCYTNTTTLKYQRIIIPEYNIPDWGVNRLIWAGDNALFVIVALIIITIIILMIVYYVKKFR